jgi:hypothetical protein
LLAIQVTAATLPSVAEADQSQPATATTLPVFGTSTYAVIEVPFQPTHSEKLNDSAAAENSV